MDALHMHRQQQRHCSLRSHTHTSLLHLHLGPAADTEAQFDSEVYGDTLTQWIIGTLLRCEIPFKAGASNEC